MTFTIASKIFLSATKKNINKTFKKIKFKTVETAQKTAEEKITSSLEPMANLNKSKIITILSPTQQAKELTSKLKSQNIPFDFMETPKGLCVIELHPETKFPHKSTLFCNNGKKRVIFSNGDGSSSCNFYNHQGKLLKIKKLNPRQQITEEIIYHQNGEKSIIEYDTNYVTNLPKKETLYASNSTIKEKTEFYTNSKAVQTTKKYNKIGKLILSTNYTPKGKIKAKTRYDCGYRPISSLVYSDDNSYIFARLQYDSKGRLYSAREFDAEGNVIAQIALKRKTEYFPKNKHKKFKRIEYYIKTKFLPDGRTQKIAYNIEGKREYFVEYNPAGKKIFACSFYPDGKRFVPSSPGPKRNSFYPEDTYLTQNYTIQ